jgi:hypothetical protein
MLAKSNAPPPSLATVVRVPSNLLNIVDDTPDVSAVEGLPAPQLLRANFGPEQVALR